MRDISERIQRIIYMYRVFMTEDIVYNRDKWLCEDAMLPGRSERDIAFALGFINRGEEILRWNSRETGAWEFGDAAYRISESVEGCMFNIIEMGSRW